MKDRELERMKILLETAIAEKRELTRLVEKLSVELGQLKTELEQLKLEKVAKPSKKNKSVKYPLPEPDVRWDT